MKSNHKIKKMKKVTFLFFSLLILGILSGCGYKEEIERLQRQRDSLLNITQTDAATLNEYLAAFNEIQENLNEIKRKENIITLSTQQGDELSGSTVDQITEDIQTIYQLLQENRQKLEQLKKKLKAAGYQNAQLKKTIELYEEQLKQKDEEIARLRQKLEEMNIYVGQLTSQVDSLTSTVDTLQHITQQQQQTIQEQDIALHTAYYVVGTKDELKAHNIVTREGLLSKLSFNTEAELSYFVKIDIREVNEIPINAKSVEILTKHPSSSYELITSGKTVTKLKIKNPDEFWKFTKFLVIMVK